MRSILDELLICAKYDKICSRNNILTKAQDRTCRMEVIMKTKKGNLLQNQRQRKRMLALLLAAALTAETAPVNVQAQGNGGVWYNPDL